MYKFLEVFGAVARRPTKRWRSSFRDTIVSGSPRPGASGRRRFTTRPELIGAFGAVSSTHWLASAVGMSILERGGNAFDAAVATGFALQIVEPHLSGPAGDMPALFYSARDRAVRVLCAQGTAPAAATIAKFPELGLGMIPGTGFLAAAVPGAFDGWMLLLRDFGTMTVEEVLTPAIGYAERGFPILPRLTMALMPLIDFFKAEWPSSAAVWLPGGKPPTPGALFATPAVAQTYKRILAEAKAAGGDRERQIEAARNAFYRGFVAEAIERFATRTPQMDGSGRRNVGLLTARRHGEMERFDRSPDELRLWPLSRSQDRPLGSRAGAAAATGAPERIRTRRARFRQRRFRACRDRMLQARLRRPRGVLRRSGVLRDTFNDALER